MQQRTLWLVAAAIVGLGGGAAAQERVGSVRLAELLARVGARVERYFERAQAIVCDERVYVRPMGYDSNTSGPVRVLGYELRVAWEAATPEAPIPEASVLRRILTINGRAVGPDEEPGCLDPASISPEPLSVLLSHRRLEFVFTLGGRARENDRDVETLQYRPRRPAEDVITWKEDCVNLDLPGRTLGRIWADAQTGDVLRLDERVNGLFEFDVPDEQRRGFGRREMVLESYNSSIRYRPVTFTEPDETLLLPVSIDTMSVWRGAGSRRVITTQEFSGCRRFITDARLLEPGSR